MQTDIFKVMADEYLKGVTEPEVKKPTPQGLGARSSLSMKNPEADANTVDPIKMGSAVDTVAKYYNKIIAEQIKDTKGNVSTEKGVEYKPVSYSPTLDGAQDLAAAGYDFDMVLRDSARTGKLSSATPPRNVKSDILSKIEFELSTEIAAARKKTKLDPYIDVTNRVQDSEGNIVRDKKSKQYRDEYYLDTGILLEEGGEPLDSSTREKLARQAIIDAKEKVKSAEDEYFLDTGNVYEPIEFKPGDVPDFELDAPEFEPGDVPEVERNLAGPDFELDAPEGLGLGSKPPGFGENYDRNKKYSEFLYDRFLGSGSPDEINKALLNTPEDQRQEVMDLILETMEADEDFEASPNVYKAGFIDDFVAGAKKLFGLNEEGSSGSDPINVRNNNLGNIKNVSSNNWQGQTNLKTKETFASFSSPELGVRALKKVIQANINATSTIEEYVNRYASEPKEKAYFKKTGSLMPHLKNYALIIAKSQGLDSEKAKLPKKANMLEWIKATAKAEGGAGALSYFTDDVINAGIKL